MGVSLTLVSVYLVNQRQELAKRFSPEAIAVSGDVVPKKES
jgi:hypothetical protein